MKFLIVSDCGESLAIALRLLAESNEVRMCIVEPKARDIGEGLVEKIELSAGVRWCDVCVFDSNELTLPSEAEKVRRIGKPCIGSSKLAGELEHDRKFGADIARKAGIRVSDFTEFQGKDAFAKAREFLSARVHDENWVWKPNNSEVANTYVGSSPDLFLRMLTHYEQLYKDAKETPDFILTKAIQGVEVSTEGWFNGKEFLLPNHTIERNRLMNDDLGEKTGCMGNVVWSERSKLFDKLFSKLVPILRGKYNGPFDVNVIINKENNEPTFLEFTPRIGYDAIFAFIQLMKSDLSELLAHIASGASWSGSLKNEFAASVRIHIPPYPEAAKEEHLAKGVPIDGFSIESYDPHIAPCEIMLNDDGECEAAGRDGYLFVVSSTGKTIQAAYEDAYKRVEKLVIPQMRYRTDLAKATSKVYNDLKATGWIGAKERTFTDMLQRAS